ncbi:LacI family DNA-binding transcriptional regulator [Fodinicola feengrottensis]|uniref:DNA-binding transcriptional regulator CytR n=1 Tax=Fodinicola feengrottensis TaxID=435914 RepID=A0ABN2HZU6_9ACTN|nr:GntR family transcriptional regulator [Fodinicola feengrottensis]
MDRSGADISGQPKIPRYEQVKQDLLGMVSRGEYVPNEPFVSQREVCERFGVSTTTAIKALNDLVSDGVLIRQQGRGTFVAERPAPVKPTRRGSVRSIACVIHGMGPHLSAIVSGVESVCADLGIQLVLSDSKASVEVQDRSIRRALDNGVSGVVLYPVDGDSPSPAVAELVRRQVPLVTVDRYFPELATDAVIVDNFAVGFELTSYLLGQGHQRMATLWDEADCTSVRDRLSGHVHALTTYGVPVCPDFTLLRSYRQLPEPERKAILSGLLDGPEPPTVLLCAHGYMVATVAHDLAALGREVPGEVELAGMDDAGPFNVLPLTIAAAALPATEMGRQGMRLLAERIDEGKSERPCRRVVLPVSIRTRESALGYLKVVSS